MSKGRTPARRLLQSILTGHWAIHSDWLLQFASIAGQLGEDGTAVLTVEQVREQIRTALATLREDGSSPEALAFDHGESLGEETRATVRDRVAIIPVIGPLYHYADAFHDVCGCSSYAQITRDITAVREARALGTVRSVLLEVDSPGGEVGGCGEAAGLIAELAREMPVAAYVSDLGCSAAYYLASAAGEVVTARGGILGSIGVRTAIRRRGDDNTIEIVSSQSPRKVPDVETDAGKTQIRETLNALAQVFIEDVAAYRGVAVETVMADFGQGDVLVGQRAVDAGLADRTGTMEGLLLELREGTTPRRTAGASMPRARTARGPTAEGNMPHEEKAPAAEQPVYDRETVAGKNPQLVSELRADGAVAERERILAIQALHGPEDLRAACVLDPKCSVGEAAIKLNAAQKAADEARGKVHLQDRAAAEQELEAPKPSGAVEAGSELKQLVAHSRALQEAFTGGTPTARA